MAGVGFGLGFFSDARMVVDLPTRYVYQDPRQE